MDVPVGSETATRTFPSSPANLLNKPALSASTTPMSFSPPLTHVPRSPPSRQVLLLAIASARVRMVVAGRYDDPKPAPPVPRKAEDSPGKRVGAAVLWRPRRKGWMWEGPGRR